MRRHSAYERFWMVLVLVIIGIPVYLALQAHYWPEKNFDAEIVIAQPAEKIWPYLTEPELRTRWETGLTDIIPSLGEAGETGSRAFAIYYLNGERFEAEEELVAMTRPDRIEKTTHFDAYILWSHYRLTKGDTVKITYQERIRYHAFRDRFWAPLVLWGRGREIKNMLNRLKQSSAAP